MRYIIDTNIVLHMVRNSATWKRIKREFFYHPNEYSVFVSIVSIAEIKSLAKQLNWGYEKVAILNNILNNIPTLYINKNIVDSHIEIDVYSQVKDRNNPLPFKMTPRNMGKNDLWIAATTKYINAELITTDNDFDFLNKKFFNVHNISQSS